MPLSLSVARRVVVVATILSVRAEAQCPDGSPPPCGAQPRRVTARQQAVTPPGLSERRRTFLVLPFRNLSRAQENDWLVEGSPVLIGDALSRNDSLTVVPDERLYPAMQRAGLTAGSVMDLARVRRVAEETGGWTAITGEILSLGNRLRVSARAFDVVSNTEMLRAVEEAAPGEDVRAVYERISTRLVRAAGAGEAAANLATTTTRSVDAYRAFVRGVVHENRSEVRRARDAFLEAVRLDSTYAQAYARLAETEINLDPRQITNLQSPLYRHARRAAELAANLPPKDRDVVLALNDILSSRFGAARERLERLVAQDSMHVDAVERLASLEMFDPILVPRGSGERPRGSINKGLTLAKRVLELDPARHQMYGSLVQMYLLNAGMTPGMVLSYRAEAASFPLLLATPPAVTFVPVLRDTVMLVPFDSVSALPADTLRAARARALDAARQWLTRWLAVGHGQAEPHLWASRMQTLAGDFDAALRELEAADSLGVETGLENVPVRRMSLLARLGRYAEGQRIADSLWVAGALNAAVMHSYQMEGAGWGFTLFVLGGNLARAESLMASYTRLLAPAAAMNPDLTPEGLAYLFLTGSVRQFFTAPGSVRLTVFDRVASKADSLSPTSPLVRTLPFGATVLARDTSVASRELADRLLPHVNRLAAKGNDDLAYRLAIGAGRDSAARRAFDTLPWYARRWEETRSERLANLSRFRPAHARVTDSAATFSWTVLEERFEWNRPGTAVGTADVHWEATFRADGRQLEVLADVTHRPGAQPASGSLRELLQAAVPVLHHILSADTTVAHRLLSRTAVTLELEPGGFRMVLRDPGIVAALRRERPATARMRFRPCLTDGTSRCVDEQVPITYP